MSQALPQKRIKILSGPIVFDDAAAGPKGPAGVPGALPDGWKMPDPPESLDKSVVLHINTCTHPELYLLLSALEGVLRQVADDFRQGKVDAQDEEALRDAAEATAKVAETLVYGKQATVKFGVRFSNISLVGPKGQEIVTPDSDYQAWYRWWQEYIQSMDAETWTRAQSDIENGNDTAWIHPPTLSWKN